MIEAFSYCFFSSSNHNFVLVKIGGRGLDGPPGSRGARGAAGKDGADGNPGKPGTDGKTPDITELKKLIQDMLRKELDKRLPEIIDRVVQNIPVPTPGELVSISEMFSKI